VSDLVLPIDTTYFGFIVVGAFAVVAIVAAATRARGQQVHPLSS
jgi:hypothetical protein